MWLRFGLGDGRERSLDEVGRLLGVSRERVRQVQQRALIRLRELLSGSSQAVLMWFSGTGGIVVPGKPCEASSNPVPEAGHMLPFRRKAARASRA